jgi:hypothetical protein
MVACGLPASVLAGPALTNTATVKARASDKNFMFNKGKSWNYDDLRIFVE